MNSLHGPDDGSNPASMATAPILVAIDGRAAGWEALRWAAREAFAQERPLRILHVFKWPPLSSDAYGYVLVNQWYPDAYAAAQAVLEEAKDRALQVAPTLHITTQVEAGSVVAAVLRARERDDLLVIGRRRPVGRLKPAPWSVSWMVARRSAAPVVLVGVSADASAAPSPGRVVVVVDDLESAFDAVAFALATACRWGVGVTAVVALGNKNLLCGSVEGTLRNWSEAFPDVHLRTRLVIGRLGPALAEESLGAALVVVGGHRRGRIHSAFIGSVDGELIRHSEGPIAFVRAQAQHLVAGTATFRRRSRRFSHG